MPAYHTRTTLPMPPTNSSQRPYFLAAAAAKLRAQDYEAGLRLTATLAAKRSKEEKEQRQQARRHENIKLPRDPVKVAKRRAAAATAALAQSRMPRRGVRWYDGAENPVPNGAALAKARAKKKQNRIERKENEKKEHEEEERRQRRVRMQQVLLDAKVIVNKNSDEFEPGSFRLLKHGSLHGAERKRVLEGAFGLATSVHSSAWIPGGYESSVVCTRGTKQFLSSEMDINLSVPRPRPVGFGGCVRLFSS